MQNLNPKNPKHKIAFDEAFAMELAFILDEIFNEDTDKFGEMFKQLNNAVSHIDNNWRNNSKKMKKPKLSTYDYRSYKFFSSNELANTPQESPDLRVIFKYCEEENLLLFLAVGIRVDKNNNTYLPREHDVYERINSRKLPEEE